MSNSRHILPLVLSHHVISLQHAFLSIRCFFSEETLALEDNGQDNVHVLLVNEEGNIQQELGETSGVAIRTSDTGFPEGKIYIDYNCANDNKVMTIYLDNEYQEGDPKPSQPVLEFTVDLANFFTNRGRFFTAGFTGAINGQKADNADITSWVFSSECEGDGDDPGGVDGPTPQPTPQPTPVPTPPPGPSSLICNGNGLSQLTVGSRSNSIGEFLNVAAVDSLRNAIDCLGPNDTEEHTQTSHVWWSPQPLELIFDLTTTFTITEVLFWNYYEDFYDVDRIEFTFTSNTGGTTVYTFDPVDGRNAQGANQNPLVAERWVLPTPVTNVVKIQALLSADDGREDVDFQNIVFVAL
jgi:hypothetical protein